MKIFNLLPKSIRESYAKDMSVIGYKDPDKYFSRSLYAILFISLFISLLTYFIKYNGIIVFFSAFVVLNLGNYFVISLKAGSKIKKIEDLFPDVIQLMSSNLRAGMTVDKSFLLSARPEFYPLDEEILHAGKEIATGKEIIQALSDMAKRIGSDKIDKTIKLIISGLRSGGNISTLLEQTASNMREKEFVEKRAASNVLMYVIFIFFAVAIGAPMLFGLSSVLVEIIIKIGSSLPATQSSSINLPLNFSTVNISPSFVIYFSLCFMLVTNILSCLLIGLVNKGSEKTGLKYFIPLSAISFFLFFIIRIVLNKFFADIIPNA